MDICNLSDAEDDQHEANEILDIDAWSVSSESDERTQDYEPPVPLIVPQGLQVQEKFSALAKQENTIPEDVLQRSQADKLMATHDPALAALSYVAAKHRISEAAIKDVARRVLPLHLEKPSPILKHIAEQGAEFSIEQLWRNSVIGCNAPSFDPRLIQVKSRSGQDVFLPVWSLRRWLEEFFGTKSMVKNLVVKSKFNGKVYSNYSSGSVFDEHCAEASKIGAVPIDLELGIDDSDFAHGTSLAPIVLSISNLRSRVKGKNRFDFF